MHVIIGRMPTRAAPSPTPDAPRRDVAFRSLVAGALDCGFMQKRGPGDGYTDRVTPDYVGVLVLAGRGEAIDARARRHPVGPGHYIQHPPGRPHGVVPLTADWHEFYLRFPAALFDALRTMGLADRRTILHPGLDAELLERCDRLLRELRAVPQRELPLIVARMHEWLVTVQRLDLRPEADDGQRLIDRACEALSRDPGRRLDMDELAGRLGLSYERFRKVFRQKVGVSPGEFRIRRRLDTARRLLAHDRLTVKQTAYRLGYRDPFAFSKQFKRYTGLSPTAFRETV